MRRLRPAVGGILLAVIGLAEAQGQFGTLSSGPSGATVAPIFYNMINGDGGVWNYVDYIYSGNGCGSCVGSVLTGGVGLLTDHRIAGGNWNHTALNEFGGGPQGFYVGWDRHDPTISFFFNSLASISTVWVHYDISNEGGVSGPGTVFINGLPFTSVLTGGTAPFWEAYSLPGTPASQLDFTTGHTGQWLMIDEIAFGTSAVSTIPEPTSMALLATAFGALGLKIRRRRTR